MLFLGGVALLALVLVAGKIVRGTTGWISFGFFNFQPVEIFKVVIAVVLAKYFSLNVRNIREPRHIFMFTGAGGVSVALILVQPDLGSVIGDHRSLGGDFLLAGVKKSYLAALVLAGILFCS